MAVQISRRLFTVAEYHQMTQSGILAEDDRVELIEGEIVEMSPIGSRHAACVKRLNRLLTQQVGERALIGVQDPIRLSEHSEPQPDLTLLRLRSDFYALAHPEPDEVLLLIEVAETSAGFDREVKVSLYARAGISELWLVDLAGERVEIYRQPSAQGYEEVRQLQRGQHLSPQAFRDLTITVDEILG